MFDKSKIQFLGFCDRHGFDVHDGTKNECCDNGQIIPLLNREALDALNDKGIDAFIEDFKRVTPMILTESSPQDLKDWHNRMVTDLRSFKKEVDKTIGPAESAEEGEELAEGEDCEEFDIQSHVAKAHLDGYMEGFKDGVKEGFRIAQESRRK